MERRDFLRKSLMVSAGAGAALSASAATADTFRLRMQTYWGTEADKPFDLFTENVKAASDGTVRLQRFVGSALVPDVDMLKAVSAGTLDMCQSASAYWPGELDVASIEFGLPGAWTSIDEARYIYSQQGLGALIREAYAEQNVHYLCPVFTGAYDLLTKEPVKSLEDLKRMKIRAAPTMAKILEKLGIPTVFLPASELYIGLSSGTIDGVIYGGLNEYKSLKLHEVAKHYTVLNLVEPGSVDNLLINLDRWKAMTETQQKILELACMSHAEEFRRWIIAGVNDAISERIFEIDTLPAEDTAAFVEVAQMVWEEEAAKSERNSRAVDILRETAAAMGRI